jgi:hypothetical protein
MNIRSVGFVTMILFVSLYGGCSKDSSDSPVDPGSATIPTVSTAWAGTGITAGGGKFDLTVCLGQNNDKISLACVWRNQMSGAYCVKYYNGTVAANRKLSVAGYKSSGSSDWQLDNWIVTISASGDSIAGAFTVPSNATSSGTITLTKKTSSSTYPVVSGNWTGIVRQGVGSWEVTVTLWQAVDALVADWVYTGPNIKVTSIGSLSTNRSVDLKDIAAEFSGPNQASQWTLITSTAFILSARADTISGTWVDNARNTGTALLTKK